MTTGMSQIIHSAIDQDELAQQLEACGIASEENEGNELE
jgi:hypothetical protein